MTTANETDPPTATAAAAVVTSDLSENKQVGAGAKTADYGNEGTID
jgi:hypothetical protein